MILCYHWGLDRWEGDDMDIGMIGAGKVGCSIGKYMRECGLPVAGYFSKRAESSEEAGTFTGTNVFQNLEDIIKACDVLCITVPDDAVGDVWSEIHRISKKWSVVRPLEHKVICHFSGSLSSAVFSGIDGTGASGCSVHPMYAFSDKFTSYQQLNTVIFTMEGQEKALGVMDGLFSGMGNQVLRISPDKKALYHCSASLVSNFMIGLVQMGLDMLRQCGISGEMGRELFAPLIRGNVEAMLDKGCEQALTGPIERGDCQTVKKHLEILEREYGESSAETELYHILGKQVLSLAETKNPERDYNGIKSLLTTTE